MMTEESTYAGYDGSCTAILRPLPNICNMREISHLDPSDANTSSNVIVVPL